MLRRNSASRPAAASDHDDRTQVLSHARARTWTSKTEAPPGSTESGQDDCNYMPDSGHLLPCGGSPRSPPCHSPPLVDHVLPNLPRFRTGKVRDVYDLGDTLLIVATDRISAFDYVLGYRHPGQGQGADAAVGLLVRPAGRTSCPTTSSRMDVGRVPGAARAVRRRCCAAARCWCGRPRPSTIECVARGYLSGSGWKEYRETRHASAASRCRPGCGNRTGCRRRSSRRRPRPPAGTTSTSTKPRPTRCSAMRRCSRGCATRRSSSTRAASAHAEALRHHPRRHQVRVRLRRGDDAAAHRRGADAGLVALLAGRPVRARRAAAELRQAVRARLPRGDPLEQAAARARAARRRRGPHAARSTSRRSSA